MSTGFILQPFESTLFLCCYLLFRFGSRSSFCHVQSLCRVVSGTKNVCRISLCLELKKRRRGFCIYDLELRSYHFSVFVESRHFINCCKPGDAVWVIKSWLIEVPQFVSVVVSTEKLWLVIQIRDELMVVKEYNWSIESSRKRSKLQFQQQWSPDYNWSIEASKTTWKILP